MKFNIGDKVRLTREAISYKLREQHTIKILYNSLRKNNWYQRVRWYDISGLYMV